MIALDTNLLIYSFDSHAAQYPAALQAVQGLAQGTRGWGVPLPALVEFWNLATRPFAGAALARPAEVSDYLAILREWGARFWEPQPGFSVRLAIEAADHHIVGRRIFDWQIALIAEENGATELWTHDRNFHAPASLRLVDPLS